MPPRRSKRIKASKGSEPPPEPKNKKAAPSHRSKLATTRNRVGRLQGLLEMPLDIVYEVSILLRPTVWSSEIEPAMCRLGLDVLLPARPPQPLANIENVPWFPDATKLSTSLEGSFEEDRRSASMPYGSN